VTVTRPAQSALLPTLVDSAHELTAANVVSGWIEGISLLTGPALAGGLIALDGSGAALAVFAGSVLLAASLVAAVGTGSSADRQLPQPADSRPDEALARLRDQPGVGAALTVVATQYVALGAQDVLEIVLAIKVLALGAAGAGYLGAAFGAGAVAGGLGALLLVGRHRMTGPLVGAAILWGIAYIAVGAWPSVALAFLLFAGCGLTRTVFDVASRTLLHRAVPGVLHARVFGLVEGLEMLGLALGSLAVPLLVQLGGVEAALIGAGALMVFAPLACLPALNSLERRSPTFGRELALLRSSELFGMLSGPVLLDLARAIVPRPALAGDVIVREGERGGHFYLIESGTLGVTIAGRSVGTLAAGDGFGEIALLRDGVRTATITALEDGRLYALDRGPFLAAVAGFEPAAAAAEALVAARA
jgi:hypothetical protein